MNIGVILAHFQVVGKEPVAIDLLNSLVRLGAIERAVHFSIVADTPSRPVDLTGFKSSNRSVICSSIHNTDVGQPFGSRGGKSLSGGND